MRRPAERYITPLTTTGTEEPPTPGNVHICCSFATLPALIWVSGENRVAPESRLMFCQSPGATAAGVVAARCPACANTAAAMPMLTAVMSPKRFIVAPVDEIRNAEC
jgi:hypothetical protein